MFDATRQRRAEGRPRCLSIAGSDSSGGAGIQADLKTFAAFGCYGTTAVTAVTAQDTRRVSAIHPVPPAVVRAQIEAVLGDIGADAVKTGMLPSAEVVEAVADALDAAPGVPLVVDPVHVAGSGTPLAENAALEAIAACLLPQTTVLTPNLPELERLTGRPVETEAMRLEAAEHLLARGARYVLVKGGHAPGPAVDLLVGADGSRVRLEAPRVETRAGHGTGCTLSAAISAGLAGGLGVAEAAARAKDYVSGALASAEPMGQGHGPLNFFFRLAAP